jgi:hypothetical protein
LRLIHPEKTDSGSSRIRVIALREWEGACPKSKGFLSAGPGMLVLSAVIIGYGNYVSGARRSLRTAGAAQAVACFRLPDALSILSKWKRPKLTS